MILSQTRSHNTQSINNTTLPNIPLPYFDMAFSIYNLAGVTCEYRGRCLSVAGCKNGSVEVWV